MCVLIHGTAETDRAEKASAALFSEEISALDEQMLLEVFAEVPTSTMPRTALDAPGFAVVEALVDVGLSGSRNQARTAIDQGGAYVNNRRVASTDAVVSRDDLLWDRYVVLRRGRRDYHLVQFS